MKTMIENLKKRIESQKQQVEALEVESRSLRDKVVHGMSLSKDELEDLSVRSFELSLKFNDERIRLNDLRYALYYLPRASGVDNIDGFNPELSC